ncbi:23225_t:CDS:2 [Cetraspora pellucida]|uniref:23225_t:CDS:1 n=1 Tax=Cetraspora pellucida TaxID=1433469 RepID=A0A9N9FIP4_9GLOM|nr:23225_t:CDS:2 [Cetraspora pellucida]
MYQYIDEVEYDEKDITVEIDNVGVLVKLNKSLSLNSVRQILEYYDAIKITDSIYFTKNGLVRKFKLEYGRNYDENKNQVADKKAFVIKDCEFNVLEPYKVFQLNQKNIQKHNSEETSSEFKLLNIVKAELFIKKERVVLTDEFINEIKDVLTSSEPNLALNKVIKKFGQFVPTVILFGGGHHYKDTEYTIKNSKSNKKTFLGGLGVYGQNLKAQYKTDITSGNENNIQHQDSIIFGGDIIKLFQGKEDERMSSLQDFKHDRNDSDRNIVNLMMPQNIESIFSDENINKAVDSQVFATISNVEDDKIFTCMLYIQPAPRIPKVIINRIQYDYEQKKEYLVKISWFVVGYDISFFNSILNPALIRFESTTNDYYDEYYNSCQSQSGILASNI